MNVIVEAFTQVGDVPAAFDPLFAEAGAQSLFLGRDWFDLLARTTLREPDGIVFLAARAGDQALALLPVLQSGAAKAQALANYYTLEYAPILSPTAAPEEIAAALAAIADHLRGRGCRSVELSPLVPDSRLASLTAGFRRAGFLVRSYRRTGSWYAETDGIGGAAYRDGLPSRLRNTIDRAAAKQPVPFRFELLVDHDATERGLADYEAVYARSWKEPEPFPDFIPGFAELAAAHGALRLGLLYDGTRPVAAQLWLVAGGRATIYKLAHDAGYDDQSAGSDLTLRMFGAILDRDQPRRIDYGLGDEAYKADWTPRCEDRITWHAFDRRSLAGRMGALRHDIGMIRSRLWR